MSKQGKIEGRVSVAASQAPRPRIRQVCEAWPGLSARAGMRQPRVGTATTGVETSIPVPPHAAALAESMRDIGYTLETAIADIIDNSISAGASRIDLSFDILTDAPAVAIIDDGE